MSKPEIFISIDVESDGPLPGTNSMLSLGAAAFIYPASVPVAEFECNIVPLATGVRNEDTMEWWNTQPEAWAFVNSNRITPMNAMGAFQSWLARLHGVENRKLVAVAWPAAYDFAFVNWYGHMFIGQPILGFACLDIRSYVDGLLHRTTYYGLPEDAVRDLPARAGVQMPKNLQPHRALHDAVEQGVILISAMRMSEPDQFGVHNSGS